MLPYSKVVITVCFLIGFVEGSTIPSQDGVIAAHTSVDNLQNSTLNPILEEVKKSTRQEDLPCLRKPRRQIDGGSNSTFGPLLNEFYKWLKSSNQNSTAELVNNITNEHKQLLNGVTHIKKLMRKEKIKNSSLSHLNALSSNITAEKLKLMEEFASFQKNLTKTRNDIGCNGSTVTIIDGKFCRNGTAFYIIGAYIGSPNDLSSETFNSTRLKLHGQMWNLKSAGGNLAVFRLHNFINWEVTSDNLRDILKTSESAGLQVMLEVLVSDLDNTKDVLRGVDSNPALFGVNVELELTPSDFDESVFDRIAKIKQKHNLLLFSATFTCNQNYLVSKECVKKCRNDTPSCIDEECAMTGIRHFERTDESTKLNCENYASNLKIKENVAVEYLDFLVAKDVLPLPAVRELSNQIELPVVFLGTRRGDAGWIAKTIGFLVDDVPKDASDVIETLNDVISDIGNSRHIGQGNSDYNRWK